LAHRRDPIKYRLTWQLTGFKMTQDPLVPRPRGQNLRKVGCNMPNLQDNDTDKGKDVVSRFPLELVEKLDELCKVKYRGVTRSQALRWIVEDAYRQWEQQIIKS